MKPAIAMICLLLGVFIESAMWNETMKNAPDEMTVTDFELAEESRAWILNAAIEDQSIVCEVMKDRAERMRGQLNRMVKQNGSVSECMRDITKRAEIQHWQACRVLALLKKQRDAWRLA